MVRINMMCLLGAFLGLLCLTVPCLTGASGIGIPLYLTKGIGINWYLTHCYDIIHHRYLVFAPVAFFAGVALSFVTALGGIGMALGIVSFFVDISPQFDISILLRGGGFLYVFNWGPALYIGILATIVTLGSFFIPIGPGYAKMYSPWPFGRGYLKERLLVWGRGKNDVRINMMCLLGVLLGLLCLTVPCLVMVSNWTSWGTVNVGESYQYMTSHQFADFSFATAVFFLGVALAFVTPLGGVGMALGMIGYYFGPRPQLPFAIIPGEITWAFYWGPAFYFGILAAIVTLVSPVFPVGPGYSEMYRPWPFGRGYLKERVLVWGKRNESIEGA